MDITTLFGKEFSSAEYGVKVVVNGTYGPDMFTPFVLSTISKEGLWKIADHINLYVYNPSMVRHAESLGLKVVGVWKGERYFEDEVPSLIAFVADPLDCLSESVCDDLNDVEEFWVMELTAFTM
jgi:hypothetical protein